MALYKRIRKDTLSAAAQYNNEISLGWIENYLLDVTLRNVNSKNTSSILSELCNQICCNNEARERAYLITLITD